MSVLYRKARPSDIQGIWKVIGKSLDDSYKKFDKNPLKLGAALKSGINVDCFYVAIMDNMFLIGVLGISSINKNAVEPKLKSFIGSFGVIKGIRNYNIFKKSNLVPIKLNDLSAYVHYACVLKEHQKHGVFKQMLAKALSDLKYYDYYASAPKYDLTYKEIMTHLSFNNFEERKDKFILIRRK
ncbi:MAG: hypothetical protein LBV58_03355 [Acholeplasmatales bacterium]|jgi:hypothetical protein|nr:hypothetical protein [Acholeplasmatales bacterium]